MMRRISRAGWGVSILAAALALAASSCAYYNTYYLARKYYDRGTGGMPYVADKPDAVAITHFNKSIDYSKKVIANYPKSKWVDDAYLMWARSLIGKDDPLQTMTMLRDFPTRYPDSPLKAEALFYLGVAGRKARQYPEALSALVEFLGQGRKKHELTPYAHLERARILMALERPAEAAQVATEMIDGFPKHPERETAISLRAEALLDQGEYDRARADYRQLGARARSDEERFIYLLKEADGLDRGRRYDEELALLRDALGHEQEPQKPAAPDAPMVQTNTPSTDRWGRLQLRIGTTHMLAGRKDLALEAYRRVVELFPRSLLAAEAQYRIGYVFETLGDDFEAARAEYAKVQAQSASSPYAIQAQGRLGNLERLTQYRSQAGVDSVGKKVETAFMLAELYLFQLDKPERALEEYAKVAREHAGTPHAAKAMNAEAWVLREKLQRPAGADSLLWAVVHNYPATEAQLDARDYLERAGHVVASELIKMPERPRPALAETARPLTPIPPADSLAFRTHVPAGMDSLLRLGLIRAGSPDERRAAAARAAADSLRRAAQLDSVRAMPARRDTTMERLRP